MRNRKLIKRAVLIIRLGLETHCGVGLRCSVRAEIVSTGKL